MLKSHRNWQENNILSGNFIRFNESNDDELSIPLNDIDEVRL